MPENLLVPCLFFVAQFVISFHLYKWNKFVNRSMRMTIATPVSLKSQRQGETTANKHGGLACWTCRYNHSPLQ